MKKVTAQDIKKSLGHKHREDFFLTEVKNGPTTNGLAIIDALAVKKSWTKPCITGYEIKVDRSDFMNDDKWPVYKAMCHRFYFVCPKGLIQPHELPEDVGLIYFDAVKGTLYTRRKSLFRDIEMHSNMLYYIIMNRLTNVEHPFFSTKREYLENYVEDKHERYALGRTVGTKMAKQLEEQERELEILRRKVDNLSMERDHMNAIKSVMREHGIPIYRRESIASTLSEVLSSSMSPGVVRLIKTIHEASVDLMSVVKREEKE